MNSYIWYMVANRKVKINAKTAAASQIKTQLMQLPKESLKGLLGLEP